jgi:Ca2+-binding EF-hand superfamily protein
MFICLVTATTYANAQNSMQQRKGGNPPSTDEVFSMMDENQDELLSAEEVMGPIKKDFIKIDLNNDGYISKDELNKAPKPQRKQGK